MLVLFLYHMEYESVSYRFLRKCWDHLAPNANKHFSEFRYNELLVQLFTVNTARSTQNLAFLYLGNLAKNMKQKSNSFKGMWPLKGSDLDLNLCSYFLLGVVFVDWIADLTEQLRTLHGASVSSGMKPYPKIKISQNFKLLLIIKFGQMKKC